MSKGHAEWRGYDPIRSGIPNTKSQARCLLCRVILEKTDSVFMKRHRAKCEWLYFFKWAPLKSPDRKKLEMILEAQETHPYDPFSHGSEAPVPQWVTTITQSERSRSEIGGLNHQRARSELPCRSRRGVIEDWGPRLERLNSFDIEDIDEPPSRCPRAPRSPSTDRELPRDDCEMSDTDSTASTRQLRADPDTDDDLLAPASPLQGSGAGPISPNQPRPGTSDEVSMQSFNADDTLPLSTSSFARNDTGSPSSREPRPGSRAEQFRRSQLPSRQASRRSRVISPPDNCSEESGPTPPKRHQSDIHMVKQKKMMRASSLVNATLLSGGNIHSIADRGVQLYLRQIIPLEELPTSEDCDEVLAHQLSQISLYNNNNSVLGLGLVAKENGDNVDLLCFTITRNGRYSYISHGSVASAEFSYQHDLGEFIGNAIDVTHQRFNVKVYLILFKGKTEPPPEKGIHKKETFYVIYDFNHLHLQLYGQSNEILTAQFLHDLSKFSELLGAKSTTLPCITEFLIKLSTNKDSHLCPWSRPMIERFLSEACLGSNFFSPDLVGRAFKNNISLSDKNDDFISGIGFEANGCGQLLMYQDRVESHCCSARRCNPASIKSHRICFWERWGSTHSDQAIKMLQLVQFPIAIKSVMREENMIQFMSTARAPWIREEFPSLASLFDNIFEQSR
ncbi:hypothetical protein QAD02_016252 [Eretmocerus hayati]|uniref:Uncharacterized protein n=1 Tax=Eretmocerus hayati TaxID=131215 RepID=A0ACC2PAN5_9HYME|nr:hypothetical protein QAD02_016252 [Eretmocerus hayati]